MERTQLHYCKSVFQHKYTHEQRNFEASSPVLASFVDRETTHSCPHPHPMWATGFLSNTEQIIQYFPPVRNANIVEDG